jgi:tRNA (guanine37-N1)-methyltransferase
VLIDVITIFPEWVRSGLGYSIVGRAQEAGYVQVRVHDLRDWTADRHRSTDDTPYGGGAGMVMRPGPLFAAVEGMAPSAETRVVLLSPQGETLRQDKARELSQAPHLVLLCGHYEGFDERVRRHLATDELSIGDYVLTGGELPALVVIDAVTRLLPGVLGNAESAEADSFSEGLLEYPHYTRPAAFRGWSVPDVLLSGHHAEIARWRRKEQFRRTRERRPDLWAEFVPSKSDLKLLQQLEDEDRPAADGFERESLSQEHPSPPTGDVPEEKP